eukprot:2658492-Prymnesium_polylepis.1
MEGAVPLDAVTVLSGLSALAEAVARLTTGQERMEAKLDELSSNMHAMPKPTGLAFGASSTTGAADWADMST